MVDWDKIEDFDRYPNLAEKMGEIGKSVVVEFQDEGRDVPKDVLQNSLREKGHKNISARDSVVFHVKSQEKGDKGTDYEVWLSQTSYSSLRSLKKIRENNKNTLVGAKVRISRVSKDDMTKPAFDYEGV